MALDNYAMHNLGRAVEELITGDSLLDERLTKALSHISAVPRNCLRKDLDERVTAIHEAIQAAGDSRAYVSGLTRQERAKVAIDVWTLTSGRAVDLRTFGPTVP